MKRYKISILRRTALPMIRRKGGDQKAMLKVEAPVAAVASPFGCRA
jgi:hypothetical protein